MKNFIFKSTEADLQKMFQYLETAQKNILYLTFQVDKILKILRQDKVNVALQQQVDKYFDEDSEHIPEGSRDPED